MAASWMIAAASNAKPGPGCHYRPFNAGQRRRRDADQGAQRLADAHLAAAVFGVAHRGEIGVVAGPVDDAAGRAHLDHRQQHGSGPMDERQQREDRRLEHRAPTIRLARRPMRRARGSTAGRIAKREGPPCRRRRTAPAAAEIPDLEQEDEHEDAGALLGERLDHGVGRMARGRPRGWRTASCGKSCFGDVRTGSRGHRLAVRGRALGVSP